MKWLADRFFWYSPDEYSEAQARFRLKISLYVSKQATIEVQLG